MSAKIKEALGLDFLTPVQGTPSRQPPEDPTLTSALMAFGWRILNMLSESNNGTTTIYELVEHLQIPIEIALKVIDYFESRNIIRVVRRDLKGNHTVAVTDEGRSMLSKYRYAAG